jgi:hypothetical protein
MADRPPDPGDDTGVGPDRESTTGIPRWLWVSAIIVAIVVLAVVAIKLIAGGVHVPRPHG